MKLADLPEIVPGLHLLEGERGARFPYSHAIVARGEVDALIDAGCGVRRLRGLLEHWRPERVVVSHAHPDHCSGLWLLEGVPLASPVQHAESFWRFEPLGHRFAGHGPLAEAWISYVRDVVGVREAAATDHFADGDVLPLGGLELECLHAPGHTDDHYVFFEPHHGVALLFDIDLTSFGPWYGHEESDIDVFLRSIQRVAERRPRIVVSSHKGIVREAVPERLARYAAEVERRDARILALLDDRPRTVAELVDVSPIYGGFPYALDLLRYWEGQMIAKHLRRLEARGAVRAVEGPGDGIGGYWAKV